MSNQLDSVFTANNHIYIYLESISRIRTIIFIRIEFYDPYTAL